MQDGSSGGKTETASGTSLSRESPCSQGVLGKALQRSTAQELSCSEKSALYCRYCSLRKRELSDQDFRRGEDDRRLGPCKDLYELMAFFQTPLVFFLLSHRHTSRHSAIQHAFDLCSLFQVQNPIQNLASSMNFLSVKNREWREILSLIRTTSFFCLKRKRVRKEESRIIFF